MSLVSLYVNHSFAKGDKVRDKDQKTPDYVERIDNIKYGKSKKWNVLDLYLPKEREPDKKLPVIISFHGGAWVYGDKDLYQYYCMSLTQFGFAVVNFTYGLAPRFKYPEPLRNMNQVVAWILENAEKYNLDTGNVFGVGDSAGGHGLSLYAGACTNKEYEATLPFTIPEGFKLKGVALNCGCYRISLTDENGKNTKMLMKDYFKGKVTDESVRVLDSTQYVTPEYPPVFLMTCNEDFLRYQAPFMKEALDRNKVKHVFKTYGTEEKHLWHVFHVDMRQPEAYECNRDECEFFKSLMV